MNKTLTQRLTHCTICAAALAAACFASAKTNAAISTTTLFSPPNGFGFVLDGAIFPGSPLATRPTTQVRITWDIVVAEGYDAALIDASVSLPILQQLPGNTPTQPFGMSVLGAQQGWSGSGAFSFTSTFDTPMSFFGPPWTFWTHQALGLPPDAVEVLPTSKIEIDYINNILGDTDDDGDIDDGDLGTTFANYTGPLTPTRLRTTLDGDTDGDGDVDDADLGSTFAAYTGPLDAINTVPVPEPASIACLGLGLLALRRRR